MAKKLNLSYQDIEKSLKVFKEQVVASAEVGYEILRAFGKGDGDIRRYKEGKGIVADFHGLLIKGLYCFQPATTAILTETLDRLKRDAVVLRAQPKIIAVSDGKTILAYDLRENESYENQLSRMYCNFEFFLPLAGIEKFRPIQESEADVKAAEKMAKLVDELRSANELTSDKDSHDLNTFVARLLFCFFAEDTGIFEDNLFTNTVRLTKDDGSDLQQFFEDAFNAMDTRREDRRPDLQKFIDNFPYVNGGLFSKHIQIPAFNYKARKLMLECGEQNWKKINPDIFGSMFQGVVNPELRATQGMHYTSVPNIMKVICPLFLDELRETYNKLQVQYEQKKQDAQLGMIGRNEVAKEYQKINDNCIALLERMSKMKFFDPACGSGNFLIITYKALRLLEIEILKLQKNFSSSDLLFFNKQSYISINQFYGIEIEDFPHEIAMLSLWLAEHQMNCELYDSLGINTEALPLKNIKQLVRGNACRLDWNTICPHTKEEEVYVFGNPPYVGSSLQSKEQKADMEYAIGKKCKGWRKLDYIATWFIIAANYTKGTKAKLAFVSTNSICQGEQVSILWPTIFNCGLQISFAHQSFKWSNNAKFNAGVTVIVLGLSSECSNKVIYVGSKVHKVGNINPYLIDFKNLIIYPLRDSISGFKQMLFGSKASDGGFLILEEDEKNNLLNKYPDIAKFIKKYVGSDDAINGYTRYCIWVEDKDYLEANQNPELNLRFEGCRKMRLSSTKVPTFEMADYPYKFAEIRYHESECIVVPSVSSEQRKYIPIDLFEAGVVTSNAAFTIYNADLLHFGILITNLHMLWTKAVGGYLGTSIRYSVQLVYNTFPFPKISDAKRAEIEAAAKMVLKTRRNVNNLGKTLAEMYDPDTMPADLREAHRKLDDIVDSCYPGYPFANDDERLAQLFKMYEKMTKG